MLLYAETECDPCILQRDPAGGGERGLQRGEHRQLGGRQLQDIRPQHGPAGHCRQAPVISIAVG